MKKLAAAVIAVLTFISTVVLATPAQAVAYPCSDGGSFNVVNNVVTSNNSCHGAVVIPAAVTEIANNAFYVWDGTLSSVTFEAGSQLTTLGDNAFYYSSLDSIVLPEGLRTIGRQAFFYTTLSSITIPSTVTSIGEKAFYYSGTLASLSFASPSQLTTIGPWAFAYQILSSVTLPASLTTISDCAFFYNERLAEVRFTGNAPSTATAAFFGLPAGAKAVIGSGLTGYGENGSSYYGLVVEQAQQQPALIPRFSSPSQSIGSIPNGILTNTLVWITNYNSAFTYTATSTAGTATIDSYGGLRITDHDYGVPFSVVVTTSRSGYLDGTATYSSTAVPIGAATTPVFGPITKLENGFEAEITNYTGLASQSYVANSTAGSASVISRGFKRFLVVSGLASGQSATVTVDYYAWLFSPSRATISGEALLSLTAPLYPSAFAQSATSAFVTWGSVDGATGYRVTASNGGGTCTNTINYCTISGLTAGQNYTFEIVALRDSQVGPAAVTAGVLMASALDVGGSLSSSTWKVGAVVTATPLIVGQHSVVRYEWYRCNAAVPVSETVPACEVIAGADGAAYTLKAADLGKYVTAHLRVTGGAGQVGATIANSRPVLAASAAGGALVDPDGKPLIAEIPTRQISVVGGTTITINGTGFTNVTSVLVNGVAATVLSATDTTLIISVPASNQVGLVDVAVVTPKGTVTEASALAYVAKQASISSKSRTLTGFAGSATKLTAKQKAEIKAFVRANASLPKLVCAATTAGVKKTTAETKATQARARAACSYAASVSSNVFTATKAAHGKTSGKVTKLVTITISN